MAQGLVVPRMSLTMVKVQTPTIKHGCPYCRGPAVGGYKHRAWTRKCLDCGRVANVTKDYTMVQVQEAGDIWSWSFLYGCLVVVATNGELTNDGRAVMGKGTAKQALDILGPDVAVDLGQLITSGGNHVYYLAKYGVVTFPTKELWWDLASLELIQQSTSELDFLARFVLKNQTFVMPLVGCGSGGRRPDEVWPIINSLPPNVTVIKHYTERKL